MSSSASLPKRKFSQPPETLEQILNQLKDISELQKLEEELHSVVNFCKELEIDQE
jgi:hypothetical protein